LKESVFNARSREGSRPVHSLAPAAQRCPNRRLRGAAPVQARRPGADSSFPNAFMLTTRINERYTSGCGG